MIWSSYSFLESTKKLIEANGSTVKFLTSGLFDNFFKSNSSRKKFTKLEKMKINIIKNNLAFFLDFTKFVIEKIPVSRLPGGHFSQKANDMFSEHIWTKLNNK